MPPNTVQAPYVPPPEQPSSKRKYIIGGVVLFLFVVGIGLGLYLVQNPQIFKSQASEETLPNVAARLEENTNTTVVSEQTHPRIFLASLEYNPQTGEATQYSAEVLTGDLSLLEQEPTISSDSQFVYKIEVVGVNNTLLAKGWEVLPREVLETPQRTLYFQIASPYHQGALLFVSVVERNGQNKLIWTAKME